MRGPFDLDPRARLGAAQGDGVGVMNSGRADLVAWVGGNVLPHEAEVRRWLAGARLARADIDDVIQEVYCRIAALPGVGHIEDGRAYFFRAARNVAIERGRRARTVRLDSLTEIGALDVVDLEPSPERHVAARRELRRVQQLIEDLPERCRTIFKLRRMQGLPQREIARRLGVTENVVEAQAARGLRLILQALAEADHAPAGSGRSARVVERRAKRQVD